MVLQKYEVIHTSSSYSPYFTRIILRVSTNTGYSNFFLSLPISYVFHCWLNLRFSDYKWEGTSFHMLISNLNVFFGELLIFFLCPFSIEFVCILTIYWSSLYIRDINICLSFVLQIFYHLFFDFIFVVFCHVNLFHVLKYIYFLFLLVFVVWSVSLTINDRHISTFFFLSAVQLMFKQRT